MTNTQALVAIVKVLMHKQPDEVSLATLVHQLHRASTLVLSTDTERAEALALRELYGVDYR